MRISFIDIKITIKNILKKDAEGGILTLEANELESFIGRILRMRHALFRSFCSHAFLEKAWFRTAVSGFPLLF